MCPASRAAKRQGKKRSGGDVRTSSIRILRFKSPPLPFRLAGPLAGRGASARFVNPRVGNHAIVGALAFRRSTPRQLNCRARQAGRLNEKEEEKREIVERGSENIDSAVRFKSTPLPFRLAGPLAGRGALRGSSTPASKITQSWERSRLDDQPRASSIAAPDATAWPRRRQSAARAKQAREGLHEGQSHLGPLRR